MIGVLVCVACLILQRLKQRRHRLRRAELRRSLRNADAGSVRASWRLSAEPGSDGKSTRNSDSSKVGSASLKPPPLVPKAMHTSQVVSIVPLDNPPTVYGSLQQAKRMQENVRGARGDEAHTITYGTLSDVAPMERTRDDLIDDTDALTTGLTALLRCGE